MNEGEGREVENKSEGSLPGDESVRRQPHTMIDDRQDYKDLRPLLRSIRCPALLDNSFFE